ncbi:hypothetical protein B9Z55_018446 [Caenorhabditis nigoni]|uniref:Uncharacterized protein n=1 Tax=Caenorhabditis nigoni TaxID=1611254 RepID=A0A2G5TE48_9PELO|nr:hypothetical protein B9Z55_018446 [Caenorhabditis nigoni]
MNSIYTAEFDENRAFPVMAYANALCSYIQQLAPDHIDDVAKVCINIKSSHEYFLRKSMENSQANLKTQIEDIPDNVAEIANLKAQNGRLNFKVGELELEKNTADVKIAELVRVIEMKNHEASQVAANARILASRKCEKNRDIDELNEKIEKLENNGRQMSERNTELQISRKSMEAQIAEQTKKINEIEAETMELKKDLKLKNKSLKNSKKTMDHMKTNSTELEREIHYFRQKLEAKDSEIGKLKENIGVMETRCTTYARQLEMSTMEVFDLENELEALSLYVPTHTALQLPGPVANNEQSERDPLVERVKEDNEKLQEDTHEEKTNDFMKEIDVMESKENLKNVEDMNM